jgi:hypothetical protein
MNRNEGGIDCMFLHRDSVLSEVKLSGRVYVSFLT